MFYCRSCRKDRPAADFNLPFRKKSGLPTNCHLHYCVHEKLIPNCRECGNGKKFCAHGKFKWTCGVCSPRADILHTIRSRYHHVWRKAGGPAGGGGARHLGCSFVEFTAHIERQFSPGMTWENHGEVWEIDHIIPLGGKIDGVPPSLAQVVDRMHWSNVRPLWKVDNRKKGARMPAPEVINQTLSQEFQEIPLEDDVWVPTERDLELENVLIEEDLLFSRGLEWGWILGKTRGEELSELEEEECLYVERSLANGGRLEFWIHGVSLGIGRAFRPARLSASF